MLDKAKSTLTTCNSVYSRRKELAKKLLRNPFVPILFIGEFIKTVAITAAEDGVLLNDVIIALFILAVVTTVVWVFAEHILDEARETFDEVVDDD